MITRVLWRREWRRERESLSSPIASTATQTPRRPSGRYGERKLFMEQWLHCTRRAVSLANGMVTRFRTSRTTPISRKFSAGRSRRFVRPILTRYRHPPPQILRLKLRKMLLQHQHQREVTLPHMQVVLNPMIGLSFSLQFPRRIRPSLSSMWAT